MGYLNIDVDNSGGSAFSSQRKTTADPGTCRSTEVIVLQYRALAPEALERLHFSDVVREKPGGGDQATAQPAWLAAETARRGRPDHQGDGVVVRERQADANPRHPRQDLDRPGGGSLRPPLGGRVRRRHAEAGPRAQRALPTRTGRISPGGGTEAARRERGRRRARRGRRRDRRRAAAARTHRGGLGRCHGKRPPDRALRPAERQEAALTGARSAVTFGSAPPSVTTILGAAVRASGRRVAPG